MFSPVNPNPLKGLGPLSLLSAAGGIASNGASAAITKVQGDSAEMIAEGELADATEREKRMKRFKEMMNWSKVGPGAGVTASAAAERSATSQ